MNVMTIAAAALTLAGADAPRKADAPHALAVAGAAEAAAWAPLQGGGNGKGGGGGNGGGDARGRGNGGGGGNAARAEARPRQGGESRGRGGDRPQQKAGGRDDRPRQSGDQGRGRSDDRPSSSGRGSQGNGSGGNASTARSANRDDNRGSKTRNERANARGDNRSDRGEDRSEARSEREARRTALSRAPLAPAAERRRVRDDEVLRRVRALPPAFRRLENSDRRHERLVLGAAALGTARGLRADDINLFDDGGRLRIVNRRNELLFDLDERRARELGSWRLRRLGDRTPRADGPAFCRSGEGHPVWGREWCLDKGWGLGRGDRWLWSRADVDDVVYRRIPTGGVLDRGGLIGVLGDIVLGRLALHALSMGYDAPLAGAWVAEPQSPQILRIHAGDHVVAEFVDVDRDDRAEVLYVIQPL